MNSCDDSPPTSVICCAALATALASLLTPSFAHADTGSPCTLEDGKILLEDGEEIAVDCAETYAAVEHHKLLYVACGAAGVVVYSMKDRSHPVVGRLKTASGPCVALTSNGSCLTSGTGSCTTLKAQAATHSTKAHRSTTAGLESGDEEAEHSSAYSAGKGLAIVGGSLLGLGALGVAVGAIAAFTCSGSNCSLGGEVVAMFSGVVAGVGLLVLVPGIILMSVSDYGRKAIDTSTAQSARTPMWQESSALPIPRYSMITFSFLNGTF